MAKHVIVIASGETERRALPYLLAHLMDHHVHVDEVRIPPRGRALNVEMAEKLVKAAWFENAAHPPHKFVVLVDADGAIPDELLRPLREHLPARLRRHINATVLFAHAQWHLEAWYFADAANLRSFVGRALGNVDTSAPDQIQNPKLHLKNLLGERVYTSVVSEDIAKRLNAQTIAQRSPSFRYFQEAVLNGESQI